MHLYRLLALLHEGRCHQRVRLLVMLLSHKEVEMPRISKDTLLSMGVLTYVVVGILFAIYLA